MAGKACWLRGGMEAASSRRLRGLRSLFAGNCSLTSLVDFPVPLFSLLNFPLLF